MGKNTKTPAVIITECKSKLLDLINQKYPKVTEIMITKILELKNGRTCEVELREIDLATQKLESDWALGKFRIKADGRIVSTFELYQMPHCCGICVSTASNVITPFQKLGIATYLNQFRQDVARIMGYTIIFCTDCEKNTAQKKVLAKNEWMDIYQFKNKRTGNLLNISVKHL